MIKKLFCLLFLLVGCSNPQEIIEEKSENSVLLFYTSTCGSCQELKENLIPKLEEAGYDISLYDMDELSSVDKYFEVVELLDHPDIRLETNNPTPMIVYESYFAAVGYNKELDDFFMNLFNMCKNGDTSCLNEVGSGLWRYKE